jgi:hypothetical protein
MEARTEFELFKQTPDWLLLECYTENEVLAGRIRWPAGLRLLDLLNSLYTTQYDSSGEFLNFIDISRENDSVRTFINKAAVQMVTISENDLARGAGAETNRQFPFIRKTEVPVSLKLKTYIINGSMHLADNETIQDVLNRDAMFVPITNATLATTTNQFYGTRPFIAVNKKHITWVQASIIA